MDSIHGQGDIADPPSILSNFQPLRDLHRLSDTLFDPHNPMSLEAYTPTQDPSTNTIDEGFGNFPRWSNNFLPSYPLFFDENDKDTDASWDWDPTNAPLSTAYHDSTDMKQKREEDDDNPTSHSSIKFSPVPNSKGPKAPFSHSKPSRTKRLSESSSSSTSSNNFAGQAESSHSRRHSKKSYRTSASASGYSSSNASRAIHNNNEKQYRNRLNRQYDKLFSHLPKDAISADVDDVSKDTTDMKPSKGRILDLASTHIETLERHCKALKNGNRELEGRVRMLEKVWKGEGEVIHLRRLHDDTNTLATERS